MPVVPPRGLGLMGQTLMGFVKKSPSTLIVHDTGPDGSSTYELAIGRDIETDLAHRLITANGGNEAYTIHAYEGGERFERFVPKALYEQARLAMDVVPPLPTVEENIANLKAMIEAAKEEN